MRFRNTVRAGALVGATALFAAGCVGDGGGADVEIFGNFSGQQQAEFEKDIEAIADELGITIEYVSDADFAVTLPTRVGTNEPDIAIFPQPGLLLDLVASGDIVALEDAGIDAAGIAAQAVAGVVDTATVDGVIYGLPYSVNAKSLVWYPVPEFEDSYSVPTTHAELVALTDEIKADGTAPWCFGIDAGWPATDWLEEYVLRVGGPEVYDQWVSHEIPFNDPVILDAAQKVGELLAVDGNVFGGTQAIGQTWDSSVQPLFDDPPSCMLHRQGNFVTGAFPTDVQEDIASNVSLFLLPPVEGGFDGQPILGGGDFMALFDAENEDAAAVLAAIASPDFGENSAKSGQFISPYPDGFDDSAYPNDTLREISALLAEADAFRFDGSDSMPGEVGNLSFWDGMVEWLVEGKDLETVLDEIEASWPSS